MNLLESIKSEEFVMSLGVELPTKAMRIALLKTHKCASIEEAFSQGALTDITVRTYVTKLLSELKIGERFRYDATLALLAVSLERRNTLFAEEFLRDLAELQLAELAISIRVARECLKERERLPYNSFREFRITSAADIELFKEVHIMKESADYNSDLFYFEAA